MKYFSLVALLSALAAVEAQQATMSAMLVDVKDGPAPPTAPGGGAIHEVMVGTPSNAQAGTPQTSQLQFTPATVLAKKGDVVRFMFMAANQSVAQSTWDAPCAAMAGGAVSGFKQNSASAAPPTFDVTVKDTAPMFMAAQQASDCAAGMVLVVNPAPDTGKADDQTLQNFMQKALAQNKAAAAPANGLVAAGAVSQSAAGQTVTVSVQGAAAATGTASAAAAATTVAGQGTTGNGQACGCTCLCGTNAFPQDAGQGQFGGFLGQMPMSPAAASAAAPAPAAAMAPPPMRARAMPGLVRHKA